MKDFCGHVKWKTIVNNQMECVNCGIIISTSEFVIWNGTNPLFMAEVIKGEIIDRCPNHELCEGKEEFLGLIAAALSAEEMSEKE